jgi:hypothetical protein
LLLTSVALLIGVIAGALFGWREPIHVGSHFLFTPGCKPPTIRSGGRLAIWSTKVASAWVYHGGTPVFQLGSLKLIREGFSVRVRMSPLGDPVHWVWFAPPSQAPGRRLDSVLFTSSPPPPTVRSGGNPKQPSPGRL